MNELHCEDVKQAQYLYTVHDIIHRPMAGVQLEGENATRELESLLKSALQVNM